MKFYTDGSYNKKKYPEVYGWAFVVFEELDQIDYASGIGDEFIESYQIGGECQSVLEVLDYCKTHQIFDIDIFHDYIGISKWALGEWKTNKDVSKRYRLDFLIKQSELNDLAIASGSKLKINFHHVKGHSGISGNELADQYASEAVKAYYSKKN